MKIETPSHKHKRPVTGKKRRLTYHAKVVKKVPHPEVPIPYKKPRLAAGGGFMIQRHHAISA